ncbi:MAG: hypothetical protein L6R39_006083 [Caloplaca ligustica]|nr:MAG: hypothetical protein L6R39_006083 [Caloplaca ligustica]
MPKARQTWPSAKRYFHRLGIYFRQGTKVLGLVPVDPTSSPGPAVPPHRVEQVLGRPSHPYVVGPMRVMNPDPPSPAETMSLTTWDDYSVPLIPGASTLAELEAGSSGASDPITADIAVATKSGPAGLEEPYQVFELEAPEYSRMVETAGTHKADGAQPAASFKSNNTCRSRKEMQWKRLTVGTDGWESFADGILRDIEIVGQ